MPATDRQFGSASSAVLNSLLAPVLVGGERYQWSQRSRVRTGSFFGAFAENSSNRARPSSLPPVAAKIAMPMLFHSSHSRSSFRITARAAAISASVALLLGFPTDL